MDDFEINEEIIEDLYIKFDIQIDPSFDIDKLRNLVLSSDEQNFYNYQGPVAISFDNQ